MELSEKLAWFERRFPFPVPEKLLPNVLTRLRGTPARLEETLHGRSRGALVQKPAGKWSAQEHAGHLLDLEPLWIARVDDFSTNKDQLTAADLTNRKTHEANHNARSLEQVLREFRSARQQLIERVEALDGSVSSRRISHPRLQTPMRLIDHLYFVAEHDDHHLAAIWELLSRSA